MRRRDLLKATGLSAGIAVVSQLARGSRSSAQEQKSDDPKVKRKIVVVGGHPDDPETGCGGTIARCVDAGFEVVIVYLTRGEAGIRKKTHDEAAETRTAEAEEACRILGARPVFVGQIDGDTEINKKRYEEFRAIIESERPNAVFTHWPIDEHRDHRAASMLTYDAWKALKRTFELYYFEVMTGEQSQMFSPTHYVNITKTEPRKKLACMAHASQNPVAFYKYHDMMNRARGMEFDCGLAEGFVRHVQSPGIPVLDELRSLG